MIGELEGVLAFGDTDTHEHKVRTEQGDRFSVECSAPVFVEEFVDQDDAFVGGIERGADLVEACAMDDSRNAA